MTKSNYKIELRKKKIFSIPYNTQIFSMFAIILMIGAPALVSVIDDTMTETVLYEGDLIETDTGYSLLVKNVNANQPPTGTDLTLSFLPENGTFIGIMNTPANVQYADYFLFTGVSPEMFKLGAQKITITTSDPIASVRLIGMNENVQIPSTDGFFTNVLLDDEKTNSWTYEPSSIQSVGLKSDDCTGIRIELGNLVTGRVSTLEFTVNVEYGSTINYGEIIIGMTGGLLLICALFSTPWFGIGGLNIKKKRRA